jgi:hypothetical protein
VSWSSVGKGRAEFSADLLSLLWLALSSLLVCRRFFLISPSSAPVFPCPISPSRFFLLFGALMLLLGALMLRCPISLSYCFLLFGALAFRHPISPFSCFVLFCFAFQLIIINSSLPHPRTVINLWLACW